MSNASRAWEDADIRSSEAALRRAGQRALELGRQTHTPVWVLKDGKLVDLTREPNSSEPIAGDSPDGVLAPR